MYRVFGGLLVLPFALMAQTPLLPTDALSCFSFSGGPASDLTFVSVQGMPFSRAMHIRTENNSANPWDIRARCFNTAPTTANDTVLVAFWMRTTSSTSPDKTGITTVVVEQNPAPYFQPVRWPVETGPDWKRYTVPFNIVQAFTDQTANGYNLSFWVTGDPQEIEIGGLTMLDYGPNVPFSQLPLVNWPYEGSEPSAQWRADAAARIEAIRKTDLIVVVRDADGKPAANAPVHLSMKRHAFGFGSAISSFGIADPSPDGQKYRDTIKQLFNLIVFENELKWPFWETWDRHTTLATFDWLDQAGIQQRRGHNLIWPGRSNLPPDVVLMLTGPPDALRGRISSHFADVMGALKGRLTEWDVLNEPVANTDVQAALGNAEMGSWFRNAQAIDPAPKLFINDYNILEAGGLDRGHQNSYYNIIQGILSSGSPLQGIGLQSHFDANLTPPTRLVQVLDRFAAFGKPLEVTEFDINIKDEQLQADYTRDFLTVFFSHPAASAFLMWGFWEGREWRPDAAMYRKNWDIKPNGQVYNDLVFHQWWTDAQGTTLSDGTFRTRGFLGDYDVDTTVDGAPQTISFSTAAAGQPAYVPLGKQVLGVITQAGIMNAASFALGPVAPGEMVTIFGTGFGPPDATLNSYLGSQLPSVAGDTRVYFDGVAAPMISSLNGQVSAVVPYSVTASTKVEVEYLGTKTNAVSVPVASAAPGIFNCGNLPGRANIVNNSAGGINSCTPQWKPAQIGSSLTLFITGQGQTRPLSLDGALPAGPDFPAPVQGVSVSIGGTNAQVDFAGLTYAGVTQVNVTVPGNIKSGDAVPILVTVGGVSSSPASLSIQ